MINPLTVEAVDEILDERVSADYHNQPLAQDWARVGKMAEELGEALSELISYTGQNPRKERDEHAFDRMLSEMADAALSAVYGIQHFTKDTDITEGYLQHAQAKHLARLMDLGEVKNAAL